jgi:hypothetical protein
MVGGPTADGERIDLSTGQTVTVPLSTDATVTGAVLSASRKRVRELLPAGLDPVRVLPGRAAVAFLCVEYRRIGGGSVEPYDEFGVVVPAVHGSSAAPSVVSALLGGPSGYVWYLPVTTEAGRALGVEVWGYPKEVGDVAIEDEGSWRRVSVTVGGDHLATVAVDRPPTIERHETASSYTVDDGTLRRQPLELRGEIGAWPFSDRVSITLGDHPRAARLRDLDLGNRALVRFSADAEFVIGRNEPIDATE